MRTGRLWVIVGLLLIGACRRDDVISRELAQSEAAYVERFGPAHTSPMTPDQAQFEVAQGTRVLVRFSAGKSVEEVWMVDDEGQAVPAPIKESAAKVMAADKSSRTISFRGRGKPAAEIFEQQLGPGKLLVDRRSGRMTRVALCLNSADCRLLEMLHKREVELDELMGRASEMMERRRLREK